MLNYCLLDIMYNEYFGLKEAPFTIAPNPAFLFMSDRHREALAHLTYGLGDNGGFVLLTGEVGTGKTTICRCVMEQLPENTQAAFILNPTLSCEELLATICDNLKIRYKKTGATLKYLTDKISEQLVKNHQQGVNTLLVIDEAQHLKPEVLEQLRLLTNLETNTKKLLQVILIGQPELQQLLKRRDLRQLAQRITARYHLMPLTRAEVEQYIQHRLSVAQCTRKLFNHAAITAIHKISKGIPRVTNLLCDRALINAYGSNDALVSKKIVLKSAVDALGDEVQIDSIWRQTTAKFAYSTAAIAMLLFAGFWLGQSSFVKTALPNTQLATKDSVISQPKDSVDDKPTAGSGDASLTTEVNDNRVNENDELRSRLAALEDKLALQAANISSRSQNNAQVEKEPTVVGYQPQHLDVNKKEKFQVQAEDGVSDELLARFQSAIDETSESDEPADISDINKASDEQYVRSLTDMPQWLQDEIPALKFEMHIFATEGQGWVRVNGQDKYQGDSLSDGLILTEILPQQVILAYQGEQFSLPALSTW